LTDHLSVEHAHDIRVVPVAGDPAVGDLVELGKLAALRVLVGATAHEINNPLAAVVGLTELLELDLAGTPAAPRLELIKETCLRIRAPLEALVAYARDYDSGSSVVELERVTRDVVDAWRAISAARDVMLVESYPTEPLTAVGNAYQLKQAVMIALVWLQKSLPLGGTLTLDLARTGSFAQLELVAETTADAGLQVSPLARGQFDVESGGGACNAIARAHGGEFLAVLEQHRTVLTLRVPLAAVAV
jgi:hypothetical protein